MSFPAHFLTSSGQSGSSSGWSPHWQRGSFKSPALNAKKCMCLGCVPKQFCHGLDDPHN